MNSRIKIVIDKNVLYNICRNFTQIKFQIKREWK